MYGPCSGKPGALNTVIGAQSRSRCTTAHSRSHSRPPWSHCLTPHVTQFKLWSTVLCNVDLCKLQEIPYETGCGMN